MGILYIVPTPVGNLEDMTFRAIRVLKEVDLIMAEDTRTSRILLNHFDIQNKLISYHKFNEHQILENVINKLLSGMSIALISDAGTPSISDPGFLIVRECAKYDIIISTLPGPTAFVPAIVNSGLPNDRFCFEGFLPTKKGRNTRLNELVDEKRTMIFYESPHRLIKTLENFAIVFGKDRKIVAVKEISKIHECSVRGTIESLINHFNNNQPKGEFVLVVAGKDNAEKIIKEPNISKNKYKNSN